MNEMTLTVVIPFYNRSSTICRAVNSVLGQQNVNSVRIKILIIDDGSTFTEKQSLHSMMIKHNNVEVVSYESNKGACHARNVGLEKTESQFIAFLDSDDEWTCSFLSESLANITKSGWTCSGFYVSDRLGLHNTTKPMNGSSVPKYLLVSGGHLSTCCMVMKTEMARETQWNERLRRFQDWDFSIRMASNGNIPYFISKPLVIVYKGEGNRISNQAGTSLVRHFASEIAPYIDEKTIIFFLTKKIPLCLVQERKYFKAIALSFSLKTYKKIGLCKYIRNCYEVIKSIMFNITQVLFRLIVKSLTSTKEAQIETSD